MRIAVLASGHGSNLQALIEAIAAGRLAATVSVLVTDRPEAHAVVRARRAAIPVEILPAGHDRVHDGALLMAMLQRYDIALVCLAGFMRMLAGNVVAAYHGRMMNIHPALLPQFPGLHAIRQALAAAVPETGVTVHFVDEGMDTGPVILQQRVPILPGDTEASLTDRIHAVEHRLYPQAVQWFAEHRLTLEDRTVRIAPHTTA